MLTLMPGEIHIWFARTAPQADPTPELEKTLGPEEREVALRFHSTKHRLRYIFAHGVLRDILSRYLDRRAEDIRFDRDAFGKPFLVQRGNRIPPSFSMSHSGAVVLVGLASECHIGVDVEEIRAFKDFNQIAHFNFAPEECTFIMRHAPENRPRAFFRCWTRKEAYIKAVGKGLSIPLNTFDTSVSSGQAGRRLPHTADAPDVETWWLTDLDAPAGYLAAVALEEGCDRLIYSEWSLRETA